ncbi:MAG: hypothetical protein ABSB73_09740 [Solirubrobacteraceae bacterium]|jgi:hypothetical protein
MAQAAKPAPKAPAKTPPAPARATKRKLTIAEAADRWEHARRETDRLKGDLAEAAEVLDAYFERTGRLTYKDRIVRNRTGGTLVLDQSKVREFLGARLQEFQTRTKLGWSLKLLGEPGGEPPASAK